MLRVHNKKNEGIWWGRRVHHMGAGNKLQPAVNPQCSSERDEGWSGWVLTVSNYWCQPGNFILSCSTWHSCLGSLTNTRWVETTAQAGVWSVCRHRKRQKEHSRKPGPCRPVPMIRAQGGHGGTEGAEGTEAGRWHWERKELGSSWNLVNIMETGGWKNIGV